MNSTPSQIGTSRQMRMVFISSLLRAGSLSLGLADFRAFTQ